MPQAKLAKYRAKRDFSRTAEPSGDAAAPASARLRFVVQKHAASRLHYDFRLEVDGVFKSWAVTRGPSLDPADKRLAVEVEDHPLDYGDFEGTIPKGQYGGGTVMLWDRGYWAPEDGSDPAKALKKGELKFVLEGEKLHGSWVLVRMQGPRGRAAAQLAPDQAPTTPPRAPHAEEDVTGEDHSVASGRSMDQIAAGKGRAPKPFIRKAAGKADAVWRSNRDGGDDDKEGEPVAEVPSARPAEGVAVRQLPRFVEPELAKLVERPPQGAGWAHEVKFDGYRLQMRIEGGSARLRTRKGLDWTDKFPEIAAAGDALPDAIIDGEVVALDHDGAPDFAALQAALSDKRHRAAGLLRVRRAVRRRPGPAPPAAEGPQGAAEGAARRPEGPRWPAHPLCRALPGAGRCGAALGLQHVAGGHRLEEARRALPLRPRRRVDQGQVPRRPGGGDRRLDHDGGQLPLADRRRLSGRQAGPSRRASGRGSARRSSSGCCRR